MVVMFVTSCTSVARRGLLVQSPEAERPLPWALIGREPIPGFEPGAGICLEIIVLLIAFTIPKPDSTFLETLFCWSHFRMENRTPLFLEMLYKPPRPTAFQLNPNGG
jgi:hypothetical protein